MVINSIFPNLTTFPSCFGIRYGHEPTVTTWRVSTWCWSRLVRQGRGRTYQQNILVTQQSLCHCVTTKGLCHLVSSWDLGEGSKVITLSPCENLCYTHATSVSGVGANSWMIWKGVCTIIIAELVCINTTSGYYVAKLIKVNTNAFKWHIH